AASAGTSRTSPWSTIPGGSGWRATWRSWREPLLTTRAAASCVAPTLIPTTSRGLGVRERPPSRVPFGRRAFRGFRKRSASLMSFLRSITSPPRLGQEPKPVAALVLGKVEVAALQEAAQLLGVRGAREGGLGRDRTPERQLGERLLHRLHPVQVVG